MSEARPGPLSWDDWTTPVTPLVAGKIAGEYSVDDAEAAIRLLRRTSLPFLEKRESERERVHLAVLHLAAGDLRELERWTAEAATDWRDVLIAAGMGGGDWRRVVRDRGVDF